MFKQSCKMLCVLFLIGSAAAFADPTVAEVTHRQLQAVNGNGVGTYSATDKVIVRGIVLNNPEEMLDPTPGTAAGGQWQIYIQGEGEDHAGTALWFGQYYTQNGGPSDYNNTELLSELFRINRDPNTGYIINAGDRIEVTAWYKFYKGKTNTNEKHQVDPFYDFTINVIKPAVGLPQPEIITLHQIKDGSNNFIFDSNRLVGCEYYQGCLVRIDDVNIVDPQNWGPNKTITIKSADGRTFPVLLGIGDGFTRFPCPAGQIDVIGIFDQEATSYTVCKDGYRIWVTNYDGNGLVLTDRGHKRGNLPGDINSDYKVDFIDFAEFAENWLQIRAGLYDDGQQ